MKLVSLLWGSACLLLSWLMLEYPYLRLPQVIPRTQRLLLYAQIADYQHVDEITPCLPLFSMSAPPLLVTHVQLFTLELQRHLSPF